MHQQPQADLGWTTIALGDYAGMMGTWNVSGFGFQYSDTTGPNAQEEQVVWRGIIVKGGHVNRSVTPPAVTKMTKVSNATVSDGTSNTVAVMEKSVGAGTYSFTKVGSQDDW